MTFLADHHRALIEASAISPEVAEQRGYRTETVQARLRELGFSATQARLVPALVIPIHNARGEVVTHQIRPDRPRKRDGKALKYESPASSANALDIPLCVGPHADDPRRLAILTEGIRKADAAASLGLFAIGLIGVYGWRGSNVKGGTVALADWEYVALNDRDVYLAFDSDVMTKREVHAALRRLRDFLDGRGAHVHVIHLPAGEGGMKTGLDDYIAAGHTVDDLLALATDQLPTAPGESASPSPAPEATPLDVTPTELLNIIETFIKRFVVLPNEHAHAAVALFVAHTWAFEAAHATPYLTITSPVRRSGKTRILEVLELLVARPWRIIGASEAALFRTIEERCPTVLLDEIDAIFGSSTERTEPLRALLNGGNRPGASVPRVVTEGNTHTAKDFSVYCPKVLAGIDTGRLPDTIKDRAVVLHVHRRGPGDGPVERLRVRFADQEAAPIRATLAAFAEHHTDVLRAADPALPPELDDRGADAWEPLLAIADLAGGDWPERARKAAKKLRDTASTNDGSMGVVLLGALRPLFTGMSAVSTEAILEALNDNEELPFGTWNDGAGLNGHRLAQLLRPFRVKSHALRIGERTLRGYRREDLADAFARYLDDTDDPPGTPSGGSESATSTTSQSQSQISADSEVQQQLPVALSKSAETPDSNGDVALVALQNRPDGVRAVDARRNGAHPVMEATAEEEARAAAYLAEYGDEEAQP